MTGNKAQSAGGDGQAVVEPATVQKALERLRYQRNYLAGAETGLAKLLAESPAPGGSMQLKKPSRQNAEGKRHDIL